MVIRWREEKNLIAVGKKGDTICHGELINFLEDKSHKNFSCASL